MEMFILKNNVETTNLINWLVEEYKIVKDEETKLFSYEISILSIWITFIGIIVTIIADSLGEYAAGKILEPSLFLLFLIVIVLPGASSFLGVIWFDLACRVIKQGHYLWRIENKIKDILKQNEKAPFGFEHFIASESNRIPGKNIKRQDISFTAKTKCSEKIKKMFHMLFHLPVNFILYCMVLGFLIVVPLLVIVLVVFFSEYLFVSARLFFGLLLIFILIEGLTAIFIRQYVLEVLYYDSEKKSALTATLQQGNSNV